MNFAECTLRKRLPKLPKFGFSGGGKGSYLETILDREIFGFTYEKSGRVIEQTTKSGREIAFQVLTVLCGDRRGLEG